MNRYFYLSLLFSTYLSAEELVTRELTPIVVEASQNTTDYLTPNSSIATRSSSDSFIAPYSVSVVSQNLLQDSNFNRLEDSAMFISGVEQSSNNSGFDTDLIIRGFSTQGATFLNGVMDNQRFQVRDKALIERIEILKGHSSVLYGSGSPGGSVNYISKKPLAESKHQLSFEVGNYDFYRLVADSTGPINGNKDLLYRVIIAGQLSDDFRANVSNDRATIAPSLTWHYADSGVFNIEFEYSNENQPFRFDNVYTQGQFVFDQSYVDPRAQSEREHFRFSSSLSQELNDQWSVQLSTNYFHTQRHDVLFGFYTFVDDSTLSGYYRDIHDDYDQFNFRAEVHGAFSLWNTQHQLIVGFERNDSDARLTSDRNIGGFTLDVYQPDFNHPIPATTPLDRDTDITEYGYYVHDQIDLSEMWHIFAGLRYSQFSAERVQNESYTQLTDNDALSYNAGLSFTPFDFLSTYFGYSESFQPNYGMSKNQAYLPAKRGQLYELGLKAHFLQHKLEVSSALYHLAQNNLTARDPTDPDYLITNGEMTSEGFEMQLSGQITEQLSISANYSLVDAHFSKHARYQGNKMRNTPTHSGALWSKYQLEQLFANDNLSFGGGMIFVGKREGDDANSFTLPGYIRADLFARYQIEWFSLQINMENLLDKRYASSAIYDDTVVQGNRRLVRALFSVQL